TASEGKANRVPSYTPRLGSNPRCLAGKDLRRDVTWQTCGDAGLRVVSVGPGSGQKRPDSVRRTRDPEFLHPAPQGVGVEAENLGGTTGAGQDPVGLPQDGDDVVALHGLQARPGLARGWWGGRRDGGVGGR